MSEQHATSRQHKVALALQGGGSHGAFTWGVLGRLLDDTTIDIIGVTGTSAGAMNGAVLVDGLVRGGRRQARAGLRRYWDAVGAMPGFGSFFSNVSGETAAMTALESFPAYVEWMGKNLSPYDLPPSVPPLRPLLLELIDFDRLRSQEDIQLVVCATNARTARRHVFTNRDISVDALLASACLPSSVCFVALVAMTAQAQQVPKPTAAVQVPARTRGCLVSRQRRGRLGEGRSERFGYCPKGQTQPQMTKFRFALGGTEFQVHT